MKNFTDKIKYWFEKITTREPSYERKALRPFHDWMIIFSTSIVLLILLAVVAYYFYDLVDSGKIFTTTSNDFQNEAQINENLLQKTVSDVDERANSLTKSLQGNIAPSDPAK